MYYGIHYEYPFGGMCKRPEWRPKGINDYELDLDMIKDTGFNALRIRIGLDSKLNEVEILLDLAYKKNIKIMFGFATFYVNDQFVKTYPDSKIIGSDGGIVPIDENDLRWQRACLDHPEYRMQRNDLIRKCAETFASHPSVIAWCVHNEPSNGPVSYPCYCENTLKKYRQNLIKRYDSLAQVNKVFSSSFECEENIIPPGSYLENKIMWLDWRGFMADNLSDFLNEGRDIIRSYVGEKAYITYNVTEPFYVGSSGQDWWNIKSYKLKSASLYMEDTEFAVARDLSDIALLKSFCNDSQPAWITEFQGGPMPLPGRRTLYTSADIDLYMNSIIASGVKGVFIYRWEPLMSGPEPLVCSLVEADYYDTERRLGMKKTLAELKKYTEILDSGNPLKARVAVYYSRSQLFSANMKGQTSLFRESMQGAYGMFTDLGYEVTYITDIFSWDCGFEIVVFPYMDDLDFSLDQIDKYVKNGGIAFIDLPAFGVSEKSSEISNHFGFNIKYQQTLKYLLFAGWNLRSKSSDEGKFQGYAIDHRLVLDSQINTSTLYYGDNHECALVIPDEFDQRLIISGFGLSYSYAKTLHHGIRNYIGDYLTFRVEPDIRITGINQELRPYIEARVIEGKTNKLLFLINRSHLKFNAEVKVINERPISVELEPYSSTRYIL